MEFHVGIDPYFGQVSYYNEYEKKIVDIKINGVREDKIEKVDLMFEEIKSKINGKFGNACIFLYGSYVREDKIKKVALMFEEIKSKINGKLGYACINLAIFEEIKTNLEIPYEKFVEEEDELTVIDTQDVQTSTVMQFKNSKKRARSLTLSEETGPTSPKKPSLFSLSLMPERNNEGNLVPQGLKNLSTVRSNAQNSMIQRKTGKKGIAKLRGEASSKSKKQIPLHINENHIEKEEPMRFPEGTLKPKNVTPPNSIIYKSSGASSVPPKLTPVKNAIDKKKREEKLIEDLRNSILKEECIFHRFEEGGIIGVVLSDIVKALETRIRRQKKSGTFTLNANGKLQICVLEDKGGDYTVIGVILGSLLKRNSPDAMLFAGVYKGDESRENINIAFDEFIYRKLNDLKYIIVDEERIEIEVFKIADLKMLKIFNGIRLGNAKHSCIVCTLPNDKTFQQFVQKIFEKRDFTIINEETCQDYVTFMSSVDADHIVLPILHIYLGIVTKIIKIIVIELRRIEFDLERNFAEEDDDEDEIEALKILQEQLDEAIEIEKQWIDYFQNIDIVDAENEDELSDEEEDDEGFCFASNCIVKKTHALLPERVTHTAQDIPFILKCKKNKQFYHTICVGMNTETAKNQKKRQFEANEVDFNTIKKAIEEEVKEAGVKVVNIREKLNNEFYKNMAPEKESKYVKVLESIFKGFGATKQMYFQEYTGNHIRLIVKNAGKIFEKLIDPETKRNIGNEKIRACCVALDILKRIQDKTEARLLEESEIDEVEKQIDLYRGHMQKHFPNLSICHKNHKLLRHVAPYAKKWKTIGFFTEAPIEHQHKINKDRLRLIATNDEFKKCEFLLKSSWEKNFIVDTGKNLY
uniref:Uncharacterized protein n=1 Tax=Panagrolaimus sp. PS1159 TaxID=55785 RepID=A0AC35GBR4_9BILA